MEHVRVRAKEIDSASEGGPLACPYAIGQAPRPRRARRADNEAKGTAAAVAAAAARASDAHQERNGPGGLTLTSHDSQVL